MSFFVIISAAVPLETTFRCVFGSAGNRVLESNLRGQKSTKHPSPEFLAVQTCIPEPGLWQAAVALTRDGH
jgi:hypothetical protein